MHKRPQKNAFQRVLNLLARSEIGQQNYFASLSFPLKRFSPEPAGGQNRPPSESKHKRHHGRFPASPNMAQTPFRSSAVPLRCFPPVVDLTDAFFACIPPRQRKISPRRGSWTPAVSWRRTTMRTDVMAFPWRGRRLSMRALTRVPRRRSCCMLGPPTDRNHAPLRDLSR